MLRQTMIAALAVLALIAGASVVDAQVGVNIAINLPGPPSLRIIPQTPVAYAPAVPANLFFYGGHYYVFANNGWYAGPAYNGPWVVVAPPQLPPPLLAVPVRYYRAPPPGWKHWKRAEPPHWDKHEAKAFRKAEKEEMKAERKEQKEIEKEARKEKHKR